MSENVALLLVLLFSPFMFSIFYLQDKADEKLYVLYEEKLRDVLYKQNVIILPEEVEMRKVYKLKKLYVRVQLLSLLVLFLIISSVYPFLFLGLILLPVAFVFYRKRSNKSLRPTRILIKENHFTLEEGSVVRRFDMDEIEDVSLDYRNAISFKVKQSANKKRVEVVHEKAWFLYEYINEVEVIW